MHVRHPVSEVCMKFYVKRDIFPSKMYVSFGGYTSLLTETEFHTHLHIWSTWGAHGTPCEKRHISIIDVDFFWWISVSFHKFHAHLRYSKYVIVYEIPSLLKERNIHEKETYIFDEYTSLLTCNFMHTSAHLRYSKYVITVDIYVYVLFFLECMYASISYSITYIHTFQKDIRNSVPCNMSIWGGFG